LKTLGSVTVAANRGRTDDADPGYRLEPPARFTGTMLCVDVPLDITNFVL